VYYFSNNFLAILKHLENTSRDAVSEEGVSGALFQAFCPVICLAGYIWEVHSWLPGIWCGQIEILQGWSAIHPSRVIDELRPELFKTLLYYVDIGITELLTLYHGTETTVYGHYSSLCFSEYRPYICTLFFTEWATICLEEAGYFNDTASSWNVMAHAQKPDFVFWRKGRVHLNRRGASVQSTTGSRGVRISGSNAGYTMFWGNVKSTGYPLHSPVSPPFPLSCVTVCHHISTGFYPICNAHAPYYIVICGLPGCTVFFHVIS